MNKIYYIYGTMYSGKSLNLISTYHTYKHNNKKVLVLKPSKDTRDLGVIKSRMSGETVECVLYSEEESLYTVIVHTIEKSGLCPDIIMIDEIQFSTLSQINELHKISKIAPIMCYGLKTTYTGELFPAISKLLAIAEDVREVKTTCRFCTKKATHNLLIRDGVPIYEGAYENIEGQNPNDEYVAVCREHFYLPGR